MFAKSDCRAAGLCRSLILVVLRGVVKRYCVCKARIHDICPISRFFVGMHKLTAHQFAAATFIGLLWLLRKQLTALAS
jgi:hypothetical protein